jgi:HTH-type transcriptional regulator/antitoxin HipB
MATYPIRFSSQMREHLRALRKQQGLTQAQLGARLGVSQARIAEIEANPGLISVDQLLQLLSHLNSGLLLESGASSPSPKAELSRDKALRIETAPKKLEDDKTAILALAYKFKDKKGSW